jgi:hypothetical protein
MQICKIPSLLSKHCRCFLKSVLRLAAVKATALLLPITFTYGCDVAPAKAYPWHRRSAAKARGALRDQGCCLGQSSLILPFSRNTLRSHISRRDSTRDRHASCMSHHQAYDDFESTSTLLHKIFCLTFLSFWRSHDGPKPAQCPVFYPSAAAACLLPLAFCCCSRWHSTL